MLRPVMDFLSLSQFFFNSVCVYINGSCTYMSEYPRNPEEDVGSPGAGVTGGCELQCGCWKLNEGPLQQQCVQVPSPTSTICS